MIRYFRIRSETLHHSTLPKEISENEPKLQINHQNCYQM
jgi:hypothetical protein